MGNTKITPVPKEECHQFSTGAVRSQDRDNVRYDLISPIAMRRIAEAMSEGSIKYGDYNWEKGMPVHQIINHALAHIFDYLEGDRTEDHLGHALWNLQAACHSDELWPELNRPHLRTAGCQPPQAVSSVEGALEAIHGDDDRWRPTTPEEQAAHYDRETKRVIKEARSNGVQVDAAVDMDEEPEEDTVWSNWKWRINNKADPAFPVEIYRHTVDHPSELYDEQIRNTRYQNTDNGRRVAYQFCNKLNGRQETPQFADFGNAPWAFTERHNAAEGKGNPAGFDLYYKPTGQVICWTLEKQDIRRLCIDMNREAKTYDDGISFINSLEELRPDFHQKIHSEESKYVSL